MTLFLLIVPPLHLYLYSRSTDKNIIDCDVKQWISSFKSKYSHRTHWKNLSWLLYRRVEFRNLFYYRIRKNAGLPDRWLLKICQIILPPMNTLFIDTPEIGPGLVIQHGFATIISAQSIGENCWINQQVTVGYSDLFHCPTIGNNVKITAGAKIIGDIHVGDNAIIGANAVVVKNVPPNCTVVGVPAYIVRQDGHRVTNKPL